MRRYKKLFLSFLFVSLAPLAANAQVPELTPLHFETKYEVTLGGITIGRVRITAVEDNFSYRMVVDTKTKGLVDIFAPLESIAIVKGAMADGGYLPTLYTSKVMKDGDDKNRRVEIAYDETGHIAKRSRVPGDDPKWRPVVPLEQVDAAPDPMTGFYVLRQKLREAMARNERETSVITYDGARLVRMKAKVVSRAKIKIQGKYVNAINTIVSREPIAGYTPKEMKKFKEGDPVIHVYFSADDRLMPLQATVSLFYGDIKTVLTEIKPGKP